MTPLNEEYMKVRIRVVIPEQVEECEVEVADRAEADGQAREMEQHAVESAYTDVSREIVDISEPLYHPGEYISVDGFDSVGIVEDVTGEPGDYTYHCFMTDGARERFGEDELCPSTFNDWRDAQERQHHDYTNEGE